MPFPQPGGKGQDARLVCGGVAAGIGVGRVAGPHGVTHLLEHGVVVLSRALRGTEGCAGVVTGSSGRDWANFVRVYAGHLC